MLVCDLRRARLGGWLIGLAVAAASASAHAQSTSVQAQSLFDEGRTLLAAGKVAEACAAFESSQKLDPATSTLLNLAECRQQNHQLATAWGAFTDANRMARTNGDAKLSKVASSHAKKLEARLSKMMITVSADHQIAGLEVERRLDAGAVETVDAAAWNHALPIDGGTYTIIARAPGHAPWSTKRTVKIELDLVTVEIPRLVDARPPVEPEPKSNPVSPPPTLSPPAGQPTQPVQPAPLPLTQPTTQPAQPAGPSGAPGALSASTQPASQSLVAPLVLGGVALALAGGALVLNSSGNSAYDRASASTVQSERDSLYHTANTRRYMAEGAGVAALGCAGAAVYLFVRGRSDHHAETAAVAPIASQQLAGLAVVGSW